MASIYSIMYISLVLQRQQVAGAAMNIGATGRPTRARIPTNDFWFRAPSRYRIFWCICVYAHRTGQSACSRVCRLCVWCGPRLARSYGQYRYVVRIIMHAPTTLIYVFSSIRCFFFLNFFNFFRCCCGFSLGHGQLHRPYQAKNDACVRLSAHVCVHTSFLYHV